MSDVAALERIITKIGTLSISKDKVVKERIEVIRRDLSSSPEITDHILKIWELVFRSGHQLGPNELNVLEKIISFSWITSSTSLVVGEDTIDLLDESIKLAASLIDNVDAQLESIKLCLTASTTPACKIKWKSLNMVLDCLLSVIQKTQSSVNKSAARGALIQIINSQDVLKRK